MKTVFLKRSVRDLKKNWTRYAALGLLIVFSVFMVLSLMGAALTIIHQTRKMDEALRCEDGEFSTFVPLTDREKKKLTDRGITLEEMFFLDFSCEDESVLRLFQQRKQLNLISLKEGRKAQTPEEVVLERRYAEVHQLTIGSRIKIGGKEFIVSGIGSVPDYNLPQKNLGDTSADSQSFGLAFVTEEAYEQRKEAKTAIKSEEYFYAYRRNGRMTHKEIKELLKENHFSANEVEDRYFKEYYDRLTGGNGAIGEMILSLVAKDKMEESTQNLMMLLEAEDNIRIDSAADDVQINFTASIFVGILLIVLFSYVISVFVVHTIEEESSVIGALYSMGIKRRELMGHYVLVPVLITAVSGVIGFCLSLTEIGIRSQMQDSYRYFSMPDMVPEVSALMLIYGLLLPPIIAAGVNCLVIYKRLNRTPLSLLKHEQKHSRGGAVRLKQMKFLKMYQLRQLLREKRTGLTVVFGMFLSLLVAMLAINIYVYCNKTKTYTVSDTKYEYMYTYKYPEQKVPEGGYPAVVKSMKKSFQEYTFDVTLVGITKDNPFFDTANLSDSKQNVCVGSSFANKYQLSVGDEFTLRTEDGEMAYAFTVDRIIDYSASLFVFMDIDACRSLFREEEDYFNAVFSDRELDIAGGRLYSVTTKEDIKKAADIFIDQMLPMIIMMSAAAAVIFVVVMYLMMKMMLDKASFQVSLFKVFGFRSREIRCMVLDGNFYIVTLGALLSIPLCKGILNYVYPNFLVANIAISFDQSFPWYLYAGIYVSILMLYFLINHILVRRIQKVTLAEVLKNRE